MRKFCNAFVALVCLFAAGVLSAADVKNVIWIIGDGMGPEIMGFFMQGARYANLDGYPDNVSHLEKMMSAGTWGLYFNNTYDTLVTDSAAAATQMATGELSRPEIIGLDFKGKTVNTRLELAKEKGKSVGVISDTYVTDATPAGFTAHAPGRGWKMDIARQQIAFGADVISGGGLKYFNTDENENLLKEAKKQGYRVVRNKKELAKVKSGKLLGLFSDGAMPMSVELYKHPQVPTLVAQAQKAVELMEQNKNGFVLMAEAGKIDWAAHANDAGAVLAEMKTLDALIAFAVKYADEHPDTLVYLNADHDTGLGSFVYRYVGKEEAARKTAQGEALYGGNTDYASFGAFKLFEKQTGSLYYVEEELKKMPAEKRTPEYIEARLSQALGYPVNIAEFNNLDDIPGIFRQVNEKRGMSWATQNHSASPLIGVAYGAEAERFSGVYHNTDILPRMKAALGWDED